MVGCGQPDSVPEMTKSDVYFACTLELAEPGSGNFLLPRKGSGNDNDNGVYEMTVLTLLVLAKMPEVAGHPSSAGLPGEESCPGLDES